MKKMSIFLLKTQGLALLLLFLAGGSPALADPSSQAPVSPSRETSESSPAASSETTSSETPPSETANDETQDRRLWYEVRIADTPTGWMEMVERRDGERLISESSLRLEVKRAGSSQDLEIHSRFEESLDHRPIAAWARRDLGQTPMETTYEVVGDEVRVTSLSGERLEPLPEGEWLTPFAAQQEIARSVQAVLADDPQPGDSFDVVALDATVGLRAVKTTWTLEAPSVTVEVAGAERPASRWKQSPDYAPGIVATVDVARSGDLLRSVTPMMGLEMTVVLSDRESAKGSVVAQQAPELLTPSFIYPDRKIENPRSLRSATYHLSIPDADELPLLPDTAVQRSTRLKDGKVVVRVDLDAPREASELEDRELYLRSTDFLQHDAPVIRGLLPADLPGSPAQKAEVLRRLVEEHLDEKNLDSVLAGAVEAAERGAGDCTEHAVLLAALLRAVDIPSRVATGVIYAERFAGERDFFGYHMWTQAFVDGRWLDLDATLAVPFDAAHITMAWSALEDSSAALVDLASAAPWMGGLEIDVSELAYGSDRGSVEDR